MSNFIGNPRPEFIGVIVAVQKNLVSKSEKWLNNLEKNSPMRRSLCVFSFLLLLLSAASVAQVGNIPRPAPTTRVIAVLSAMTLEIETLGQQLTDKTEMTVQGIRFTTGSLKDRRVVSPTRGLGK